MTAGAFREQDLAPLFQELGVVVNFGAPQGFGALYGNGFGTGGNVVPEFLGILDEQAVTVVDDRGRAVIVGVDITLTAPQADVAGIKIDSAITVAGVGYFVRRVIQEGDAALVKLLLGTTKGT